MQNQVRFSCTALKGGKKGVLPKDENGYREFPVGALNVFNSSGEYYTYEGAKDLFESSSTFMRRVKAGVLKSEMGHPKPLPGMSQEQYANRVMTIEEQNVAAHLSEIWLDTTSIKDESGKPIIAIMAKVRPTGPFGPALEDSFNNPKDNTCFSIRAFTEDTWSGGTKQRILRTIVTFDAVIESGLAVARKYRAPGLESYVEAEFTKEHFMSTVKPLVNNVATESSKGFGLELFDSLGWRITNDNSPHFNKWR